MPLGWEAFAFTRSTICFKLTVRQAALNHRTGQRVNPRTSGTESHPKESVTFILLLVLFLHSTHQAMKLQKILLPLLLLALVAVGIYYATNSGSTEAQAENLSAVVQRGEFKIRVTATGELKAKNSVQIKGPSGMRPAGIYNTTIQDLVPEGTVVGAGDYVANLDRTELTTKMKEAQNELDKILTQLEQAEIDTAIELRGLRNDLINLKFGMQEKRLQVEQSRYEPQMVIQQAEIDLQKSERDYQQLAEKYELSQTKSIAQISEILASQRSEQLKFKQLRDLAQEFTIKAPQPGMVIYARNWNGKTTAGSQISSWNPVVAELPDLDDMISKTFVNEVDISKVKQGQEVQIKVDAFPDREYSGTVVNVANIGEQLRGYDSKVFEVSVQLSESDSILRPAMTTSNEILTFTYPDVLSVPLEALYSDSLSFVYKEENGTIVRQEVIVGDSNDDAVIIEHGLAVGDTYLFAPPEDTENLAFVPVDPAIKAEIRERLERERAERRAAAQKRAESAGSYQPQSEGGGDMIIVF